MPLTNLDNQELLAQYHLTFRQLKGRITIANSASAQQKHHIFETQAHRASLLLLYFNQLEQELLARSLPTLSQEEKTILPPRSHSV